MTINIYFTSTAGIINWIVPFDWNNTNNQIAVIGGGGSGVGVGNANGAGGGGFVSSNNISLRPGETIYISVGRGGKLFDPNGGNTWVNFVSNIVPDSSVVGLLATGGNGLTAVGGVGVYGNVLYNGGRGDYLAGGGAGGPHGNGENALGGSYAAPWGVFHGGVGDAGYGGAGGIGYIKNGGNGTEWGLYGSGGGAVELDQKCQIGQSGNGGLYGGGASTYGLGGQGIVLISYTPGPVIPPSEPPPEANTPPSSNGGGAVCGCLLPVFDPNDISTASAKRAQYYWAYGSWEDSFSGAYYDTNYNKLLSLISDDDSTSYDNQYDTQTSWSFINEQENVYIDYPRVWKSRSNEWVDDNGQRSVWCRHRVAMANSLCLPSSEPSLSYVTCTTNLLYMNEQTRGWKLSYTDNDDTDTFSPGDVIAQDVNSNTTVYGTIFQIDPNYIWVNFSVGQFFGGMTVYNTNNRNANVWVTDSVEINEKYSSNVFIGQSRYITKSTVLASGQDAEDLKVYMGTYRPANTDFNVYAKIISGDDYNLYSDRIWTKMVEIEETSKLFSSSTNLNDFVDLVWDFPSSQLLYGNISACVCESNNLFVWVPSTKNFYTGLPIYLTNPETGAFNVRDVAYIVDNNILQLMKISSFSCANVNIGIIPNLVHPTAAFLYDGNFGTVRYVTEDDICFDSFNQFAVKVVPISDNPVVVPRATDLRILALSV